MRYIFFFVLFLFLFIPVRRCFGQFSVHFTLRSYHIDRSEDHREWNWGVGVGYALDHFILETGWYMNSENDNSFYLGATKEYPRDSFVGVGGSVGFVTGYDNKVSRNLPVKLTPFISPGVFVGKIPRLRVAFIPYDGGVVASQVKIDIDRLLKVGK